jgi:hypothetical protein
LLMDARKWLRANGYIDEANLIDEIMAEWRKSGNGTRRNWWDKLAGRANGEACIVGDRKIPVLRAAQIRQGKTVTANAICNNENEEIPPKRSTGRWKQHKTAIQ